MLSNAKLAKILELIEKKSQLKTMSDSHPDSNVFDISGGNYDDAYGLGVDDGEISFARELQNIVDGPEPASVINA